MANGMQEAKMALRQRMKATISQLSTEDRVLQSNHVFNKVIQHPKYIHGRRIGIYLSLPDEIQTERILKDIFSRGKTCFIPRYNLENMSMVKMKNYEELDTFPKTKWNISQPSEEEKREEALENGIGGLDVLLVPGRAFTKLGYRLGRGKGYYDKYLAHYKNNCAGRLPYLIGLAFSEQIVERIPVSDTDFKLDEIIFNECDI